MYFFNISLSHHFKNSWTILIYLMVFLGFPFVMIHQYRIDNVEQFIALAIGGFLIFLIPQMFLHFNYYILNKHDLFIYNPDHQQITYNHNGESYTFQFDDIEIVERHMSPALSENRLQWLPWDGYNHAIIILKNGERFLITSLLVPNLDLPLKAGKIKIHKSLYRWASVESTLKVDELIPKVFSKKVSGKSDNELKCIIKSDKSKYDKYFILAAKKELEKRNKPND